MYVLKIRKNHKTRKFSRLFHSHKFFYQPFRVFLQMKMTEMTDFPTLLYNPTSEMPILVVYLTPEKGTPFKEKLPVQAIIGSTPLPPHPRQAQYFLRARSSKGQNGRSPVLQLNRQNQKCLLLALLPFQNVVAFKWRVDLVTYYVITSRICLQLRSLIGPFLILFFGTISHELKFRMPLVLLFSLLN